jgi:hypothetical protein
MKDLAISGTSDFKIFPPEPQNNSVRTIDILYTLDSASNYSAIQKVKP